MGNSFHDVVGKETWTTHPFHQNIINEFKTGVDGNAKLESENSQLKENLEKNDKIT